MILFKGLNPKYNKFNQINKITYLNLKNFRTVALRAKITQFEIHRGLSYGELSDPLYDSVNRGPTLFRFS